MNTIFKLILFSIVLNAATGVMLNAVVDSDGNKVFDSSNPTTTGNLIYDKNYTSDFDSSMGGVIQPTGDLEDKGNAIYRLLDKLNIGFIFKFLAAINKYLFGFVMVVQHIFAPWLGVEVSKMIFGIFTGILSFAYLLAAFLLWTDKDIMK